MSWLHPLICQITQSTNHTVTHSDTRSVTHPPSQALIHQCKSDTHWSLTQSKTHPVRNSSKIRHSLTKPDNQSVIQAHSHSSIQTLTHPLGHSLIVPDTHRDTYPPSKKFNHPLRQTLAKEVNQCLSQRTSQWESPYLRNKWHTMWTSEWPWNKLLYASIWWYDKAINMSVSRVVIERVQEWFA